MRVVLLWLAGGGLVAVAGVLAQLGRPETAPPPVPRPPAAVERPERPERPERMMLPPGDAGHVEFARQLEHAARLYREECEARAAS